MCCISACFLVTDDASSSVIRITGLPGEPGATGITGPRGLPGVTGQTGPQGSKVCHLPCIDQCSVGLPHLI